MKKMFILFMALGFILSCSFAEATVVSRNKENTKLEQKTHLHKKKTQTQKCQKSENQDNQKKKEDTSTQKK